MKGTKCSPSQGHSFKNVFITKIRKRTIFEKSDAYDPEVNRKKWRIYDTGVGCKKQTSRDKQSVTGNGKWSGNMKILNSETFNYPNKSLR